MVACVEMYGDFGNEPCAINRPYKPACLTTNCVTSTSKCNIQTVGGCEWLTDVKSGTCTQHTTLWFPQDGTSTADAVKETCSQLQHTYVPAP